MQYVVKECSEFPSMGSELVTSNLDNAIHEFQVFLKRSGAMIPSFGFVNKDGMHCDFFIGKRMDIDKDIFECYFDSNEVPKLLADAKRISIILSNELGIKVFYNNDDIQNMIAACKCDNNLINSILNGINSPGDKQAVTSVINSGWYEDFYKYDSDVCEKFTGAFEKAMASENTFQQRSKRLGR